MAAGHGGQGLVGSLQDPLGPDINPAPGRHLAVHGQAFGLETAEFVPGGPMGDDESVGDEDPRGLGVSPEDGHGLAGLDDERLVVLEPLEALDDRRETFPIPGGSPGASVDDEFVRLLGDLRIQIVHEHPEGAFLSPSLGPETDPARGLDGLPRGSLLRSHFSLSSDGLPFGIRRRPEG
jgi:hypothetical protein